MTFTVCMLTKNSSRTLDRTLRSVSFANEVVILDTGSSDDTISIAKSFPNTVVYETPFTHFGALRNQGALLAKNDWILALDSDEVITEPLKEELASLTLDPKAVYEIPFQNFYNGKEIRGCGWGNERHIRLYHRKNGSFSRDCVHEGVLPKDRVISLSNSIHHTPYLSIADFLAKMQLYTDLFAKQHRHKKKSSLPIALWHGMGAFLKCYLLKRGFCFGSEGFIISSYNAMTAFYKYLKLAEANKK